MSNMLNKPVRFTVATIVCATIAIVATLQVDVAAGSFPQAEYRLSLDESFAGDQYSAEIVDGDGRSAIGYPIFEQRGPGSLILRKDKQLVVHHINLAPEYTLRRRLVLWWVVLT